MDGTGVLRWPPFAYAPFKRVATVRMSRGAPRHTGGGSSPVYLPIDARRIRSSPSR
ncbi:hypothetical protein FHT32_006545 [Variovorax sp. SG517]|nr:hypothetical protein [Variovorax sp. SG517]